MARINRKPPPPAVCATCGQAAPCPWGDQSPVGWHSRSLKPAVDLLVECCSKDCSEAWVRANPELLEVWGRWYDLQFVERIPA